MSVSGPNGDGLLTPAEVAEMFRVNSKTVARWARDGRIPAIKTLGGHRRFRRSEIEAALAPASAAADATAPLQEAKP